MLAIAVLSNSHEWVTRLLPQLPNYRKHVHLGQFFKNAAFLGHTEVIDAILEYFETLNVSDPTTVTATLVCIPPRGSRVVSSGFDLRSALREAIRGGHAALTSRLANWHAQHLREFTKKTSSTTSSLRPFPKDPWRSSNSPSQFHIPTTKPTWNVSSGSASR